MSDSQSTKNRRAPKKNHSDLDRPAPGIAKPLFSTSARMPDLAATHPDIAILKADSLPSNDISKFLRNHYNERIM